MDSQAASKDTRRHWSHILVADELKSNKGSDKTLQPGFDLGKYTRGVLTLKITVDLFKASPYVDPSCGCGSLTELERLLHLLLMSTKMDFSLSRRCWGTTG